MKILKQNAYRRAAIPILFVFACIVAAILNGSASASFKPGQLVGVPAETCAIQGDSWSGPEYATGRPVQPGNAEVTAFSPVNSAVWNGGVGELVCDGFIAPEGRVRDAALSFSLAISKQGGSGAESQQLQLEQQNKGPFLLDGRAELQQPQGTDAQPNLDGLLRVAVSPDNGTTWEYLHTFDTTEFSNALGDGYVSFALPPQFVNSLGDMKIKIESLRAEAIEWTAYVDGVFISYEAAQQHELSIQVPGQDDDSLPAFGVNQPPAFTFEVDDTNGLVDEVGSRVTSLFSTSEPDAAIDVTVTDDQGRELGDVTANVAWSKGRLSAKHSWEVALTQPQDMVPGEHIVTVKITDAEGNVQSVERTFLWGVLALNMHKSSYKPGEDVRFDMSVLDEQGRMVCDAELTLEIEGPYQEVLSTQDGDIAVNDDCNVAAVTENPDYEASWKVPDTWFGGQNVTYNLTLTATTKNGTYSIKDGFVVGEPEGALVVRDAHTRIMPNYHYQVNFDVTPKADFKGTVTETVPDSFGISNYGNVWEVSAGNASLQLPRNVKIISNEESETQQIQWDVTLQKDKTYRFSYYYDAPNVSPELHLLGPITLESDNLKFAEPRQWQIASDELLYATSHITGSVSTPNNAVGSTTGTWTSDTGNTNWTSRWAMANPSLGITGTQTIRVHVRKDSTGGNNPTLNSVSLYENGSFVATLISSTTITANGAGQTLSGTFDASAITNPNNVEIEINTSGSGGNPSLRRSVQVDYIEWDANLAINTTIDTGTDPAGGTVAPESGIRDAGAFRFQTNSGTDSITALTVSLTTLGATPYEGVASAEIWTDFGTPAQRFTTINNPTSNTLNFSGGTPITAETTQRAYKIRITPKTHANMPVPPGATYSLNPRVTGWTGTNASAGNDTNSNIMAIDNLSHGAATNTSGTAGDSQVGLEWDTSDDGDFAQTVILRWTASSPSSEVPAEGSTYSVGNTIGAATVACLSTSTGTNITCNDTNVTNGNTYSYKIFQRDTRVNYDTGTTVSGGPFTPVVPPPDAPILYNDDGGSNQIAFNNVRLDDATPTFRVSAVKAGGFDRFKLQISANSDFSGTPNEQVFTGTYTSGSQYSITVGTMSPSFSPTDDVTYYVRVAASADSGSNYGDWSGGTWSFTYDTAATSPYWFQTTDAQFDTGALTDTVTSGSGSVQLGGGGMPQVVSTSSGGTDINDDDFTVNLPSGAAGYLAITTTNTFVTEYVTNGPGGDESGNWTLINSDDFASSNRWAWYYANSSDSPGTTWHSPGFGTPSAVLIIGYDVPITIGAQDFSFTVLGTLDSPTITTTNPAIIARTFTDLVSNTQAPVLNFPTANNNLMYAHESSGSWATAAYADEEQAAPGSTGTGAWSLSEGFETDPIAGSIEVVGNGGTASSGTIMSTAVGFDDVLSQGSWGHASWGETETNGTVSMQVLYDANDDGTCVITDVIPNTDLAGNESGFAASPINLNGLNTTTYDNICLLATLTNSSGSPSLDDWRVTWNDGSNVPPNDPTGLTQRKIDNSPITADAWVNENDIEFTAAVSDDDSGDLVRLCVEVKPLGTAFDSDGTDQTCGSFAGTNPGTAEVTVNDLNDGEYHWQARAQGSTSQYSNWAAFGGGISKDFGIDTTAPTGGNVYDGTNTGVDITFNDGSLSELSANWADFNFDISGAAANPYEYSIGVTPGGQEAKSWTALSGLDVTETVTGLTLKTSNLYYFNVRATDAAGNQAVVSSDGQFVLPTLSFSASPTSVTFDDLNAANGHSDSGKSATLTTSTNAYGGYAVTAIATDLLKTADDVHSIPWFMGGSYVSPAAWGSNLGFGYTSSDNTIGPGLADKFGVGAGSNGTLYAPFTTSTADHVVADSATDVADTPHVVTINYRVDADASQTAGTYDTTLIYVVTAKY